MTDKALCGCGKPVRYMVGGTSNPSMTDYSCNKYSRCLSYTELEALAQKRKEMIIELLDMSFALYLYRDGTHQYDSAVAKFEEFNLLRKECKL